MILFPNNDEASGKVHNLRELKLESRLSGKGRPSLPDDSSEESGPIYPFVDSSDQTSLCHTVASFRSQAFFSRFTIRLQWMVFRFVF